MRVYRNLVVEFRAGEPRSWRHETRPGPRRSDLHPIQEETAVTSKLSVDMSSTDPKRPAAIQAFKRLSVRGASRPLPLPNGKVENPA
jgi:hypothetical protein